MIANPKLFEIVDKSTLKKLRKIINELDNWRYGLKAPYISSTKDVVKFISENTRLSQIKIFELLKDYQDYLCFKWEYGTGNKKIPGTYSIINFKQCFKKKKSQWCRWR